MSNAYRQRDLDYRADLKHGLRTAERKHKSLRRMLELIERTGGNTRNCRAELAFWETQILSLQRKLRSD